MSYLISRCKCGRITAATVEGMDPSGDVVFMRDHPGYQQQEEDPTLQGCVCNSTEQKLKDLESRVSDLESAIADAITEIGWGHIGDALDRLKRSLIWAEESNGSYRNTPARLPSGR